MADRLMYEIVHRTTTRGRKIWNELNPQQREHFTKKVQEARYFDIPGVSVPEAPTSEPVKDAAWWVTSDAPEAANWRKNANFNAFQEMAVEAMKPEPTHIKLPPRTYDNPPALAGKYVTIPGDE